MSGKTKRDQHIDPPEGNGWDDGWEDLAADWRAEGEGSQEVIAPDFRRKVKRQSRLLVLTLVFEVIFSLGMISFLTWEAYKEPTAASITFGLAVGLVLVVIWVFGMVNRRGTWRPAVESTRAFVEISHLRIERSQQVLRLLPYLVLFELILILPPALWRVYSNAERWLWFQQTYLLRLATIAVLLLGLWLYMRWKRRRNLRQLQELDALRRELAEEPVAQ